MSGWALENSSRAHLFSPDVGKYEESDEMRSRRQKLEPLGCLWRDFWRMRQINLPAFHLPATVPYQCANKFETLQRRRQVMKHLSLSAVLLLIALVPASEAQKYKVVDLGTLGGSFSAATGVNNNNVIVGSSSLTE